MPGNHDRRWGPALLLLAAAAAIGLVFLAGADDEALDAGCDLERLEPRAQPLRPLRVLVALPGPGHSAEIEIEVDASGAWHNPFGDQTGRSPAHLVGLLDTREPSSLRLRVAPETPAEQALELAHAADAWAARSGRSLDIRIVVGEA